MKKPVIIFRMKTSHLIRRLLLRLSMKETWVIFFILGIIMLDYPFMDIFNKRLHVLGLPLLYLYITAGWAISIFVIYLFTKSIDTDENKGDGDNRS